MSIVGSTGCAIAKSAKTATSAKMAKSTDTPGAPSVLPANRRGGGHRVAG